MAEKRKDLEEEVKENPEIQIEAVKKNIKDKKFKTTNTFAKSSFAGKKVNKMGTFGKGAKKKEQVEKKIEDNPVIGKRVLNIGDAPKPEKKVNTEAQSK